MATSGVWVQDRISLYEGELEVFKRANSPNFYYRIWISEEKKYLQHSLKTKSPTQAVEKAKGIYKEIQAKQAREEKVFTISFLQALEGYRIEEKKRVRKGEIGLDWYNKKDMYLRNVFIHYFGEGTLVNTITDKKLEEYFEIREQRCEKLTSIKQEITIIKHFYKTFLIRKKYVFTLPEFPSYKIPKRKKAKREDTFQLEEWRRLTRHMTEWVKEKNVSRIRNAEKSYGDKNNTQKKLNQSNWEVECHRRFLMRDMILILANTGIRVPKEILSLRWKDLRVKKMVLDNMFGKSEGREELVAFIYINDEQKTGERQVIGICGAFFKRLKDYYRERFDFEPSGEDYIFLDMVGRRKGKVFDRFPFYRMWGELMVSAKLNRLDFEPYMLRSWYITNSILNDIPYERIGQNVGNSPGTILEHYDFVKQELNPEVFLRRRSSGGNIGEGELIEL
jgi:site-specific recombinase XerD